MCGGIYYTYRGQDIRVYFPNPGAMLPVRKRSGECELLPWGRRRVQPGELPMGGWARLDAIYAGRWDYWRPVPVKLGVKSFMERDIENNNHWYDLVNGQWIQGLVARDGYERRIYVVTVAPEMMDAIHDRWPRILHA
ncbi:MAG: hypothetical protein A2W28_12850 [Gammaproteobacteria bacterium RBG_16_51_14]|nr:MAG: hypothetical protein A2W28_12850 [Gammaproteobacteria bacterium RBG_16_51_14]